jgi:hypothetical protein
MARNRQRTDHLNPHYAQRLADWGLTRKSAKRLLGLDSMSDQDFWRLLRCDEATPAEVRYVAKAIRRYGNDHNLPGWEDLIEGK